MSTLFAATKSRRQLTLSSLDVVIKSVRLSSCNRPVELVSDCLRSSDHFTPLLSLSKDPKPCSQVVRYHYDGRKECCVLKGKISSFKMAATGLEGSVMDCDVTIPQGR